LIWRNQDRCPGGAKRPWLKYARPENYFPNGSENNWTMDVKLRFLGATGTVTGSRHLITVGEKHILVDCGLFQGFKQLRLKNRAPFPIPPHAAVRS
jgi:hypothetical protein